MKKGANNSYWGNLREGIKSSLKGLQLSFRHLKDARQSRKPIFVDNPNYFKQQTGIVTLQYPHEQLPLPDNGRYQLHNEMDDCIVCDKCAKVCPVDCIEIEPIKATGIIGNASDGSAIRLYAAKFDIDMSKCCFCGLCTTVCPTECLTMTKEYDFSTFDIKNHNFAFGNLTPAESEEKRKLYEQFVAEKEEMKRQGMVIQKDVVVGEDTDNGKEIPKPKPAFKPTFKPKTVNLEVVSGDTDNGVTVDEVVKTEEEIPKPKPAFKPTFKPKTVNLEVVSEDTDNGKKEDTDNGIIEVKTEEEIPKPKPAFKPTFKPKMTTPTVDEVVKTEGEIPKPKPAFKPTFKPKMTTPTVDEVVKTEGEIPKPKPAFKPTFKPKMTTPTVDEVVKTEEETPKPKPAFKPTFKPKTVNLEVVSRDTDNGKEIPKPKPAFKPTFKIKPKE